MMAIKSDENHYLWRLSEKGVAIFSCGSFDFIELFLLKLKILFWGNAVMNLKLGLIFTILLLLLFASLALNYIFYKRLFIPQHAGKLDPVGLSYYPKVASGKKKSNKPIVIFYGDSRGLSWPAPPVNHYQFLNRSIGNQTSIQVLERFNQHVAPHRPKVIIIQVCINDLKMIPLFPDKKEKIIADCKNNLQELLVQARTIKSKVILSTVFPLGKISLARKLLGMKEKPIMDAIDEVNVYIKSLASENTQILDSYGLLKGKGREIYEQYSHDWLHLNEKAYQHLNKPLVDFLK